MTYAIKFRGDNSLKQNFQQGDITNLEDLTIQCWLKTTASGTLFEHHSQKKGTYFSIKVTDKGAVICTVQLNDVRKSIQSAQGGINNGEWSYLTAIKKGDELSIIINGEVIMTNQIEQISLPNQFIEGILIGESLSNNNNEQFFNGELGSIAIWNRALLEDEVIKYYQEPVIGSEKGLLSNYPFKLEKEHQDEILKNDVAYVEMPIQKVEIHIINSSPHEFKLIYPTEGIPRENWPNNISKGSTIIAFEGGFPQFQTSATYQTENNQITELKIKVNKSLIYYDSFVETTISPDLERGIIVKKNIEKELIVHLRLSENLVITNARNLNKFLQEIIPQVGAHKVVTSMKYNEGDGTAKSDAYQIVEYNLACQLFNRRIQKKPLAIVNCTSSNDVQITYQTAIKNNLPVRVRTGGHDHEGECSGTNAILIDLIGLNGVHTFKAHKDSDMALELAVIGVGNRFQTLTSDLAKEGVMLPHGTCETVAIPGFTMGGGWGPFTRSEGMCCEHLIGAEIILGDGSKDIISSENLSIENVSSEILSRVTWLEDSGLIQIKKNKPKLVWALKGGGGMSYGIVTALLFETFKLPPTLIKFELEWNPYNDEEKIEGKIRTLDILKRWEEIINSKKMPYLTGTNLKINGKSPEITGNMDKDECKPIYKEFEANTVIHNCVMYGYWQGTEDELKTLEVVEAFIKKEFSDYELAPCKKRLDGIRGLGKDYKPRLEGWARESHSTVLLRAESKEKEGTPYPPDLDEPAPHKITSRLVDKQGLGDDGRAALLLSLTSKLILEGNRKKGLFTYVTLGAIVGDYYNDMNPIDKDKSAFPYKEKQYTIQYQTWWNLELDQKEELQDNKVYNRTNRALDWMEECRDFVIPNTSGAFISFKDSSIPTKTYFAENYDKLKAIKKEFSCDPQNHFRTRKTII